MYTKPCVADKFDLPLVLETNRMRLRPLTIHDAVKDYDAVMTSEHRLKTVFEPDGEWPTGLTLQQNIAELGWHQTEFELRTSFAYTVVSLDETEVLGCMYIYPTDKDDYDVYCTMWVRESQADTGLDQHLFENVKAWLDESWPFANVAYPGSEMSWHDWIQGQS